MKVKKITIKNHPFFEDTELKLKETNFLIGKNGSGKSFFQFLVFSNGRHTMLKNQDYEIIDNSFIINGGKYLYGRGERIISEINNATSGNKLSDFFNRVSEFSTDQLVYFFKRLSFRNIGYIHRKSKNLEGKLELLYINNCITDDLRNQSDYGHEYNKLNSATKIKILISIHETIMNQRNETIARQRKSNTQLVLFIDELENYFHPSEHSNFIKNLDYPNYQKIISTHSPFIVKNYLGDKEATILVFRKNKNGKFTIVDVNKNQNKLFPFSPTLNQIVYQAFDMPTNEFHNELYGFIESEKKDIFNQKINNHGSEGQKDFRKYYNSKNKKTEYITLYKYIRNQIHHPENTKNTKFTDDELKESIDFMIDLIK